MKNNTLSQEGYNKLNRLVDILNKKFKDNANTKMDYYEAKDAITKYNSVLKTYNIQGVDLSNIDKADTKEIEEKIKKIEDILNSNDPAVSPKEEAKIKQKEYDDILNNMDKTKKDNYNRYLNLVEKSISSSLTATEDAEKRLLAALYPDFANTLQKKQYINKVESKVDDIESAKKDLGNKLEGTLAIENYQDKEELKEIDKYYDLWINHPEYKKNILKIRDKKQERFDEIKDEYNKGNYGDKYEKDKDEKNFDDLSDDLKTKLQNEKSKYFDQNDNLTNETDFKNRVDEIAKEEKKEQLDKKEKQLNVAQGQVDKYTKNKNISEDQFRDEIEEELRQRNATFSDEDLILKDFYEVIVLLEEEVGERENKIAEIDQELDDMEIELDANGNYTSETFKKLNEKNAEIDEIEKEVDDIKEKIKETKEKMQKQQAFVNKAIDEKEELEKQLQKEMAEEDKEQQEIYRDFNKIVQTIINHQFNGKPEQFSLGNGAMSKYIAGPITIEPQLDINDQLTVVENELRKEFWHTKKSVKTQEKIDNLNDFIGTRQKVAIQPRTSQSKSQSQSQTISAGQGNTGNASQQSQLNQPNQSSKQQQIQNANNNPTQTQPYTSQVNTNGPVRVNTISARPKDVVDNNNDVVKKGRFSRFKDKVVDKFNSIKEGVKKRYNNFKNGKSNNGKTAQSQTSNTGNSQSSNNKINNNQQNQQSQAQPTIKVQSQTKTQNQNQNQTNQQQTNNKDDVKKAIEDYEKTEGQIQANVKTQQDIDKFLAENLKDIEDGKYSPKNNGKGQKQQSNNQRTI